MSMARPTIALFLATTALLAGTAGCGQSPEDVKPEDDDDKPALTAPGGSAAPADKGEKDDAGEGGEGGEGGS